MGLGPNIYQFPEGQIIAFVLVLLRIIAFFVTWPVFGANQVPLPVKILLSICLALMMFPIIHLQNVQMLNISEEIVFLAIREIAIGLVLGFMMRMFFFAVTVAGDLMSVSVGLSAAQLFNPIMGASTNIVEQFQTILATLFFLGINGHHVFIAGLGKSFELLPVSAMGLNYKAFSGFAISAQQVFLMGLKMCAPVMVAIFLTNIAMGILGKAVPQINVLVTSLPVTIMVGMGVLFFTIPLIIFEMTGMLDFMAGQFFQIMKVL